MTHKVPFEALAETIHCHPTQAEVFQRVALLYASTLRRPTRHQDGQATWQGPITPAPWQALAAMSLSRRRRMRTIRIHEFGGIDTIRLDEIPRPVPAAGEVLVAVKAAGVG